MPTPTSPLDLDPFQVEQASEALDAVRQLAATVAAHLGVTMTVHAAGDVPDAANPDLQPVLLPDRTITAYLEFTGGNPDPGVRTLLADLVAQRLAPARPAVAKQLHNDRREIRQLLTDGGPSVAWQPIIDLADGTTVGYEALARFPWGPTPDLWFARAHRAGAGVDLEIAALRAALDQADRLPDGCYLAVNLSPVAFNHPAVQPVLDAYPSQGLVLEVTEHEHGPSAAALAATVATRRQDGVRIAVDDIGHGFSDIRRLLNLRPDVLKLDRSLAAGVDQDRARQTFVAGQVALAADLGATVTAEGIETEQQLQVLTDLGVHSGQGYLLGRPRARLQAA